LVVSTDTAYYQKTLSANAGTGTATPYSAATTEAECATACAAGVQLYSSSPYQVCQWIPAVTSPTAVAASCNLYYGPASSDITTGSADITAVSWMPCNTCAGPVAFTAQSPITNFEKNTPSDWTASA